ncbi:hypothetical protein Anas_06782 [Armadillidium nasatum]|uniref:Uncharacterized protein n=1 Tax=Armadillidium nasatum TaxID=96803 RepID=A0A5N5SYP0_9CRUS|nr:hypothetical protein Anas_06782 [Armadillidium nasatum]
MENRPTPPPVETIPSRKGDLRNVAQENFRQSIHPALISSVLEKAERKPEKTERKEKKVKNVDKKNILSKQLSTGTTSVSTESKANNHSKLFIKASHQKSTKQSRIFRHKASSPVKETNIDNVTNSPSNVFASSLSLSHLSKPGGIIPVTGNSQSPIFRNRYKSLTNLDLDFDTLNSSTSGGKNSADSCVSFTQKNKIIDKKNRKLPRPKSLTNLVWDGRETSLPSDGSIFNGLGTARALLEAERKLRLEPDCSVSLRRKLNVTDFSSSNNFSLKVFSLQITDNEEKILFIRIVSCSCIFKVISQGSFHNKKYSYS